MRRLLLLLVLVLYPAAMSAEPEKTGASAAHGAETQSHKVNHPEEAPHGGAGGHVEKTYFGIPGWILKLANMILFIGVLIYFVGGPVKTAFRNRGEQIRLAAEEARERRLKADQMASQIQAKLAQIEADVAAIHERAEAEGERQKRELIAAAEVEAAKILSTARSQVDNSLKHARHELTAYAGQLAAERAEAILREKITEQDRDKLFEDSLRDLNEVRA